MIKQLPSSKIIVFIAIAILLLFSIHSIADDNSDDIIDTSNELFIIKVSESNQGPKYALIDMEPRSYKRYTITYPGSNIQVTTPLGSEITSVSNESIDIMINRKYNSIKYDETISIFSPINFKSSIRGTNRFTLDVISDNKNYDYNIYYVEWGDGFNITGEGLIPSQLTYNYNKEGVYPIKISFTDKYGIKYTYQRNQTFKLSADQYIRLWTIENKETVAAGSAGTIGILSLLGIALTETGKYKILALLLLSLPMFTKIQKEDVLDHFVRGQIYGYIKAYPGAHYNQIMRELEIKNGTLSYHLYILEKTGTIKSRREGYRYRAFYPTEIKFPEKERYRLTELQVNIIKLIQENKGINQKNLAKELNENHQTISYNIKVLQQAGIINTNKKGRKTCCSINQNISDKLSI